MQKRLFSVATLGDLNPHCSEDAVQKCVRLFFFFISFWADISCLCFSGIAAGKVQHFPRPPPSLMYYLQSVLIANQCYL